MERDCCPAQVAIHPGREETTGADIEFSEIVREHQSMVFSLAYHYLRDRALAEEVAQEAFIRLYRNLDSIESGTHLIRWLRKVAWRLCIDEKRRRPRARHLSLDETADPPADASDSDTLMAERLRQLVACLPENMRIAIILRYQEEMDPVEIARELNVPLNTIKSRLQRGLALLRRKLGRFYEGTK